MYTYGLSCKILHSFLQNYILLQVLLLNIYGDQLIVLTADCHITVYNLQPSETNSGRLLWHYFLVGQEMINVFLKLFLLVCTVAEEYWCTSLSPRGPWQQVFIVFVQLTLGTHSRYKMKVLRYFFIRSNCILTNFLSLVYGNYYIVCVMWCFSCNNPFFLLWKANIG